MGRCEGWKVVEVRRLTQSRDVCALRKMVRNAGAEARPDSFQHLMYARLVWAYFSFDEYRSRTCSTHWDPRDIDQRKWLSERSGMRTGESLNAEPDQGEDESRHYTEIAKPKTERRPVENRERDVEPSTDSPVEDDDGSHYEVPNSYRWNSLSPEAPILGSFRARNERHVPT
jgi:hypothetical protein